MPRGTQCYERTPLQYVTIQSALVCLKMRDALGGMYLLLYRERKAAVRRFVLPYAKVLLFREYSNRLCCLMKAELVVGLAAPVLHPRIRRFDLGQSRLGRVPCCCPRRTCPA